jgi:putative Mn2+ efflux pump MntP
LAFHFGFFQFVMSQFGWLAGRSLMVSIRDVDHWVASALLFIIECKMAYEAVMNKEEERVKQAVNDPTRGPTLVVLSVATSIDAFAVGIALQPSR